MILVRPSAKRILRRCPVVRGCSSTRSLGLMGNSESLIASRTVPIPQAGCCGSVTRAPTLNSCGAQAVALGVFCARGTAEDLCGFRFTTRENTPNETQAQRQRLAKSSSTSTKGPIASLCSLERMVRGAGAERIVSQIQGRHKGRGKECQMKSRRLASHGTPWRHNKTARRCDPRRRGRSGDHNTARRRVF